MAKPTLSETFIEFSKGMFYGSLSYGLGTLTIANIKTLEDMASEGNLGNFTGIFGGSLAVLTGLLTAQSGIAALNKFYSSLKPMNNGAFKKRIHDAYCGLLGTSFAGVTGAGAYYFGVGASEYINASAAAEKISDKAGYFATGLTEIGATVVLGGLTLYATKHGIDNLYNSVFPKSQDSKSTVTKSH